MKNEKLSWTEFMLEKVGDIKTDSSDDEQTIIACCFFSRKKKAGHNKVEVAKVEPKSPGK
jgi:hypothetical protein